MKNDIIIQARIGSSRLPGKTMLSLAGKPVLWHDIERCKKCKNINDIIIATTNNKEDDTIERWCIKNDIKIYRGSSNNVLNRYYEAAKKFGSDNIVRITSDCPLIDPEIIDNLIQEFDFNKFDYKSNCQNRTFPRGLDCEIFTFSALKEANDKSTDIYEQEHVTPYIIKNKKTDIYLIDKKYHSNARLTLDEIGDYQLLSYIYDQFYKESEIINTKEIIDFLEKNISIKNINLEVQQKNSI